MQRSKPDSADRSVTPTTPRATSPECSASRNDPQHQFHPQNPRSLLVFLSREYGQSWGAPWRHLHISLTLY
jgi:hypothetical protein